MPEEKTGIGRFDPRRAHSRERGDPCRDVTSDVKAYVDAPTNCAEGVIPSPGFEYDVSSLFTVASRKRSDWAGLGCT